MRRLFGSVRARAALGATVVVAVALVAAGLAVLLVLRANLIDQADLQAEVDAQNVASQVAVGRPYGDLEWPDGRPVQVVGEDGQVLAVSEDLEAIQGAGSSGVRVGGGGPDRSDGSGEDDDDDDPGRGEVSSDAPSLSSGSATVDGERADYRFAAVEATTPRGRTVTVYAGAPLAAEQAAVGTVREAMLIGLPALLVVVGGVTWLVTRRALRPVEGIRREMAAITASEDLSRRVPEPDAHDEVARLAVTTNETLAALEASVERQRRFVADASHELRSPIASLRTQLEVGAAHPELLDVEGAVRDTVRLQGLAADLLLLARLDAGERPGQGRVDLGALVREEVSQRTADRVPVAVEGSGVFEVTGSRGQLARVLGNLLDNAQRHARSSVGIRLRGVGGGAVIVEVADDGAGVPVGERERIFERFVRLDDARARDDGGAGLGLAIARDVATRHGGSLRVGEGEGGGALFTLRLPAAVA
ncbi:HAMP domain-containing histidine kinase [Streptomyces sp. ISL-96]|uniref:sensor histidine kinase n=1 Tax=Streptomyces sp. ISL-96 TaxID=2819191 RepID=UPI001BED0A49|nr:HAMP domain-containing sensor histidine kinase [Streptomyces sp. ISL-96]MBT2493199.1 HAMP domain-containing histidine kinase [Streptomyces sp. ISL-96]